MSSILTPGRAIARPSLVGLATCMILIAACDRNAPERLAAARPARILTCEDDPQSCEPPPPPPFDNSAYGVHLWAVEPEVVARSTALAEQVHAGWVRVTFDWDAIQPDNESQMDPGALARYDAFLEAASQHHLEVFAILARSPNWVTQYYPGGSRCRFNPTCVPPRAMLSWWRAYVDSMARRFPSVAVWGVWNEPNDSVPPFDVTLTPNIPDSYGELAAYAWDPIHAKYNKPLAAPELGSGMSGYTISTYCPTSACQLTPVQWLDEFLYNWGHKVDIVTVHQYDYPWAMADQMHRYGDVLRYGRRPYSWPLWLTEFGTQYGDDAFLNSVVTGIFQRMASGAEPRWQKSFLFDMHSTLDNNGVEDLQYALVRDIYTTSPTPRPAFYCFQALASGSAPPSYCHE